MHHGFAIYIRGFFDCPTRLLHVLLFTPLSAVRSVAADDSRKYIRINNKNIINVKLI